MMIVLRDGTMLELKYVFAIACLLNIFPFKDIVSVRWILKGDKNDTVRLFLFNFVFTMGEIIVATILAYMLTKLGRL